MKALAELLDGMGLRVTGSDLQPDSLVIETMRKRGLRVHQGHDDSFVPNDIDLLVYSPAVRETNPERLLATRLSIPQFSYSQMLGKLMQSRTGVAISGTHGKSTTTAMTSTILDDAGMSPSAVVGAELCGRGVSGWAGNGKHFVVESCEYQRSFLDLSPSYAAILGIELDHVDCYADLTALESVFSEFAESVDAEGTLLVNGNCATALAAARATTAEVVSFGLEQHVDWWASDIRTSDAGTRFRIFYHGDFFTELLLPLPGTHNVANALAAAAMSHHLGVGPREIKDSLEQFQGIRRRFESVGSWRGVTLIDDYAHHPTAVRATLTAARQRFQSRRIWCAFQPHQVSRTRALIDEFAKSFELADETLVVPVYTAREAGAISAVEMSRELVARITENGQKVRYLPSLDRVIATLEDDARPGDVVITMGAGDINRVQHEFNRRLQRNPSA